MLTPDAALPDDLDALKALVAHLTEQVTGQARTIELQDRQIETLRLQLAALRRQQFGRRSEKLQAQAGDGLPLLRGHQRGAAAGPADSQGQRRPQPAGRDHRLQVRRPPATLPSGRTLRPRRPRPAALDPGRLDGPRRPSARPAGRADRRLCPGRHQDSRRRYPGAGAGTRPRQNPHRPAVGLCPRRPPGRRHRAAGGALPLQPRPQGRASHRPSRHLHRIPSGRRLCRLRRTL